MRDFLKRGEAILSICAMNFKTILVVCFSLISILSAEPIFRIHDGNAWKEIDAAAWEKLPRTELVAKARDGKDRK